MVLDVSTVASLVAPPPDVVVLPAPPVPLEELEPLVADPVVELELPATVPLELCAELPVVPVVDVLALLCTAPVVAPPVVGPALPVVEPGPELLLVLLMDSVPSLDVGADSDPSLEHAQFDNAQANVNRKMSRLFLLLMAINVYSSASSGHEGQECPPEPPR